MRALITGASGFVGPHLSRHLSSEGDDVTETDRATGLDIADTDALIATFRAARPEVIFHLAGDSDVGGSWSHPASTFRANAEGTLNVLSAARETGVDRVIAISSADVYGKVSPEELPLTEDSPLRPTSPYAASKVAAEFLAVQADLGFSQQVIRVRAFNHLGPGQSTHFVAPAIADRIASNEVTGGTEIPVGNLAPRRDFTDVRDVVRAYRLLALHGAGGEVYNVCSAVSHSIEEIAQCLIDLAAHPMQLVTDPALQRPVDIPALLGDYTRLRAATGWQPTFELATTLGDLLDSYRKRRSENPPSAG